MRAWKIVFLLALIGGAILIVFQTRHSGQSENMDHAEHNQNKAMEASVLSEPGQGAFAALSEVVRVLEANPNTDWSKVDLSGLRAHLIDMDRLISDVAVTETDLLNGIKALSFGDAEVTATLHRMVPAHAAQLAKDDRWSVETKQTSEGMELRVTSDDPSVVARIKGLGFFGLMASQDHHRKHHLMMALGENAHNH